MLGNRSDCGGNRSLQYIQTKTRSPVFSSPTPLVGFYNIAPSQHQPRSGVIHSPPVPGISTSYCAATLFFVCHQHFLARRRFSRAQAFDLTTSCPLPVSSGNRCPSFHPLASLLWPLGCLPPTLPKFLRVRIIFPALKNFRTRPDILILAPSLANGTSSRAMLGDVRSYYKG